MTNLVVVIIEDWQESGCHDFEWKQSVSAEVGAVPKSQTGGEADIAAKPPMSARRRKFFSPIPDGKGATFHLDFLNLHIRILVKFQDILEPDR